MVVREPLFLPSFGYSPSSFHLHFDFFCKHRILRAIRPGQKSTAEMASQNIENENSRNFEIFPDPQGYICKKEGVVLDTGRLERET
jgi:hypothetical protein